MDIKRRQLISDYSKGLLDGKSYVEIERIYDIPATSKAGDRVRKWINWYNNLGKSIGQYAPGKQLTSTTDYQFVVIDYGIKDSDIRSFSGDSSEHKVDKEATASYKNLVLKSKWQVQTKNGIEWLESYNNNVDPKDIIKFREDLVKEIPSFPVRNFRPKLTPTGTLGVISIPDFHIGREKNQENNNIFISTIEKLLNKSSHHNFNELVFVIGNDYLNSDFDYKTTKGTQQFDYQTWRETWANGRDLLIKAIETLKSVNCPVTIINIPGNHDTMRMFQLGDVISAYYREDQQVRVDNSDRLIKAFKYADVLLAFEHGEFRREEYESILANEFPELWGTSKYREFLCGHLHAETVKEFRGIKLRHLPSLANESEWEKKQGYKHKKEAQMLVYSKEKLESIYIE